MATVRVVEEENDEDFLTVSEIAGVFRVSKMTVYRLVGNGEMNAVRIGNSIRVRRKEVNAYLKRVTVVSGVV